MYVFLDESGRFDESPTSNYGVIVLVLIPDNTLGKFTEFFQNTFGDESPAIKASNLTYPYKEKVIKYIGTHPQIKFAAFIHDHKASGINSILPHQQAQVEKIDEAINRIREDGNPSLITDLELLRNQFRKKSETDYLKINMTIQAFIDWSQYCCFDVYDVRPDSDSWKFHFILDSQNHGDTFKRMVYSMMMLSTNERAQNPPKILTPTDWYDTQHPFMINYDIPGKGMDMKKFYSDFRCGDDKIDIGLKIPDLISNIIFRSISRINDESMYKLIRRLWSNRSMIHRQHKKRDYYRILALPSLTSSSHPSRDILEHWHHLSELSPKGRD